MKTIAVISVDFNSEKETHDCLTSLRKLEIPVDTTISIIVVDNASKVPFLLSKEEKEDDIQLIRNDENLGFSGGYNTGMQYALAKQFDYIMIINNDTIVDKALIKELLLTAEKDRMIGLVGPKIYFAKNHEFHKERYTEEEKGKVLWYAGGGFDWNNILTYHRGVDEVDRGQYDKTEKTGFVTGCCMLFKREVLEKVGLLDDDFFLYFEDADINQRIQHAGYTIMYAPKAVLWHINAASSGGSGSLLHDYYITRNRMMIGMRYAPLRSKIALLRESIQLLFMGRKWQKKGIWDYYIGHYGKGSFHI